MVAAHAQLTGQKQRFFIADAAKQAFAGANRFDEKAVFLKADTHAGFVVRRHWRPGRAGGQWPRLGVEAIA